jgi:hypothetical protein
MLGGIYNEYEEAGATLASPSCRASHNADLGKSMLPKAQLCPIRNATMTASDCSMRLLGAHSQGEVQLHSCKHRMPLAKLQHQSNSMLSHAHPSNGLMQGAPSIHPQLGATTVGP